MNKEQWRMARMIAYNARIGSHLNPKDPKSIPRTEELFLPIDGQSQRKRASKEAMEQLKKEQDEFYRNNPS